MIDLHIHTDASDGQYTPRRIFEMAKEQGISWLAFADHNSVANVKAGGELSRIFGIGFIPAVEVNTNLAGKDIHVLAYHLRHDSDRLSRWLGEIRDAKMEQARLRVAKLADLGLRVEMDRMLAQTGGLPPTGGMFLPFLLEEPANDGHPLLDPYRPGVSRETEGPIGFYLDYFKEGKPAYVGIGGVGTFEAIDRIREFAGTPILAHPRDMPEKTIVDIIVNGIAGLEAYSSYHDQKQQERHLELAKRFDLVVTAGSDFHGPRYKPHVQLGVPDADPDIIDRLEEVRIISEDLD